MRRAAFALPLLVVLVVLVPLVAWASTRSVTVTGWGVPGEGGLDGARARAIADALGRAVQAGGRTAVSAETRLVNDWDLSSMVASETFGVVRGYRIVEEGFRRERGYRVKLVAQIAQEDTSGPRYRGRVLVIAREQYRGAQVPPQLLATALARRLREKGFAAAIGEWRTPLVSLARGDLRVNVDHLRQMAEKHEVEWVLVAWAEARHSDTANASLHSSRALGKVQIYAGEIGALIGSKAIVDVLGWGPTPERAGEAALREARGPLAAGAVMQLVAGTGPR